MIFEDPLPDVVPTASGEFASAFCDGPVMAEAAGNIVLFRPHIPKRAGEALTSVAESRWIGQGPKVDLFEEKLSAVIEGTAVAVNSGTSALHLAYILAGLRPGDEVLTPVFTCTATNIPLLYEQVRPVFVDIHPSTLTIDLADAERKVTANTRAIAVVHYGGYICNMAEVHDFAQAHGLKVVEDAAQALGGTWDGRKVGQGSFTAYSFQAIKHITTGDGGALQVPDEGIVPVAKRLRWFGIDRGAKQAGTWENRIWEVGYKYQMTDLAASLGLLGLDDLNWILEHRRTLLNRYLELITDTDDISVIGRPGERNGHAAWIMTISTRGRLEVQERLRRAGIESAQVHFRNDRYEVFGDGHGTFPGMDSVEDRYLVLPLHTRMNVQDVDRIVDVLSDGRAG